jgi:hypothetical protein
LIVELYSRLARREWSEFDGAIKQRWPPPETSRQSSGGCRGCGCFRPFERKNTFTDALRSHTLSVFLLR